MTTAALSERLAEAAGPIVVKEVRQGLRAKVFAIFFGLLLTGCLLVALIAAAEFDRRSSNVELGPDYFRLFLAALGIVEFFVIPYMAYRAMAREREDETWVLLILTGLGPRRIVRGKVASALAQGLLYASACAPFVLFSYYLNGIDLPTVLVALVMSAAWSCLLVCLGVAAATQAHSRIGRALVHFLVLFVMLGATAAGIAFAAQLAEVGGRLLRENVEFAAFCLGQVVWSLSTAWVASEGAASGLALLSENAAKGPRLALTAQTLLAVLSAAAIVLIAAPAPNSAPLWVASMTSSLYLGVIGMFAVSEHDGYPPAFARVRWFRPGALRSFRLMVLLLALYTAAWLGMYVAIHGANPEHLRRLLTAPLYVLLYLSLGVLIGRLSPLKAFGEPIATRVGVALAVALGTVLPMFIAVLSKHRADEKSVNMLNPLLGLAGINNGQRGATTLNLAAAAALLFAFLAWTVLSARDVERRT